MNIKQKTLNATLSAIMSVIIITAAAWYFCSDPAAPLQSEDIIKVELWGRELKGEALDRIRDALREGEKSRYVMQLPAVENREDNRIYSLYVEFADGHNRFLWSYDFSEPGIFYGGGGRIVDGLLVGYGGRVVDGKVEPYIQRKFFRYYKYDNPTLFQILESYWEISGEDEILPEQREMIRQLEQDWQRLTGGKEIDIAGYVVGSTDFNGELYWSLSPDQKTIAFILSGPYISLTDLSVSGLYDCISGEFHFSQILFGDASYEESRPVWSPTGDNFAYTLSTAKGRSLVLMIEGKDDRSISIGGYTTASFLQFPRDHLNYDDEFLRRKINIEKEILMTGETDFLFKNLRWSDQGNVLFFTTEINAYTEDISMELAWSYDPATEILLIKD